MASHVHNKVRPDAVSRSTQKCLADFSATIGPRLILYTGTMLRFPSPILLPYTGDRGYISLSRKKAFAERTLIQEKILICYQHVLFRWGPNSSASEKNKLHPESQRRAVDRDDIGNAHHETLHRHARG